MDRSVIKGFKSLQQLEQLILNLPPKQEGVYFLLEGLAQLPLLVRFDISIAFLQEEEQALFSKFLRKQSQLTRLSIKISGSPGSREEYNEQDRFLGVICQTLTNKPRLKCLCFESSTWSVESLSRGLGQAKMADQLEELDIGIYNHLVASSSPSKVEGLCDFIKRQKRSLRSLKILIGFVKEDEIVNNIVKAIADAEKLQSLDIAVNMSYRGNLLKYEGKVQGVPMESLKGFLVYKETFVFLKQTLQELRELCHLSLHMSPIMTNKDGHIVNSSIILNALPEMKNLRTLTMRLPCLRGSIRANPDAVLSLLEAENLVDVYMKTSSESAGQEFVEKIEEIDQILKPTEQKRYLREHLLF